jgi:LacI family transcriptional regulator
LADQLIELGYRSAAILTGPRDLRTARRTLGFAERFAAHGHPILSRCLLPGDFTRDGGFLSACELVRRGLGQVEVVLAVNDMMAVGAITCLRSAGVRLPDDLAVAGFDDIASLRDITPALTTGSLPLDTIGRTAITLAFDHTEDGATRIAVEGF